MKSSAAVLFTLVCVLVASLVLAGSATHSAATKCVPSASSEKPFLAYVEDGLALVLDIPLAMLSPICCPILAPIINRLTPLEAPPSRPRSSRR